MGKYDPAPTVAAGLIRAARQRSDLTQQALAELAGITQQAISAYETGRMDPTLATLSRIIRAAGFEMRIRLHAIDDHDEALQAFLEGLPPDRRAELEEEARVRASEARLRRVRGK